MDTKNTLPPDEVICHCSGTKRDHVQSLFEQGLDMYAISRWTGALSGCGGCEWDIAQLLKELAEQQTKVKESLSPKCHGASCLDTE
ncbi:MAG: (2Fe-2S)-binding protein [Methylotenera sp.]|nr:(2Fe-2S)-binding protein [Methylotenera sp.]